MPDKPVTHGEETADVTVTDETETPTVEETVTEETETATGEETEKEQVFTQEQVEAIIGRRLAREKAHTETLKKDLAEAVKLAETAAALKEELETVKKAFTETRVSSALTEHALKAGVPQEKLGTVRKLVEMSEVYDENGEISDKKVADQVKKVLTEIPELATAGNAVGNGPGSFTPSKAKAETLTQAIASAFQM